MRKLSYKNTIGQKTSKFASLAQLVEPLIRNEQVVG